MSEGFGSGPLVGRDADLATVTAAIEGPGGGAMVIADPGMGKTALARAVVDRLGERVHPVWVYASETLSGIPFGALAPHLAPLSPQDSGSVLAAMRSLKTQFRKQSAGGTRMLLVIDDVQELDESSAVLAAQLVTSGTAKVLALAKSRNPLPQEILSLISDRLLSRHVLRPLDE